MAPTSFSEPHPIIQSWVTVEAAQRLKAQAKAEGCSLSSLVRDALEENFASLSVKPSAKAQPITIRTYKWLRGGSSAPRLTPADRPGRLYTRARF